jgi:hypothetical protein
MNDRGESTELVRGRDGRQKPSWIWHGLYHAFVWPDDHERGVLVTSACGRHQTRTRETKCMGAPHCLDCAEALGMNLTDEEIRPSRGLGYRREFQDPDGCYPACSYCGHEKPEWRSEQDKVGVTPSGLYVPQSAIDAMKKNG